MRKNFYRTILAFFFFLVVLFPVLVGAQMSKSEELGFTYDSGRSTSPSPSPVVCTGNGLSVLICKTHQMLNNIVPVLLALGLVYFVWGVVNFMIANSEEAKTKGKDKIIYGLIGFAVIMGVWGLVTIVVNTLGIGGQAVPTPNIVVQAPQNSSCTAIRPGTSTFSGVLDYFTCIANKSIIPFIFAIAIVYFVWGLVKFFIVGGDEEKKRQEGKQFMMWGIIALAVMLSVWGVVSILQATFGVDTSVLPRVNP